MNKEPRHSLKCGGDISSARDKLSNLRTFPEFIFSRMISKASSTSKIQILRNRVRSYFNNSAKHNLRIHLMVSRIHDFSLIVTDTEAEALILEEQLIKRHTSPLQRGSQGWKIISVLQTDCWRMYPRLMLVREKIDAKSEYYGPYPSVKDARQVLKAVMTYFPLRTSKMLLDGKKTYRPCLNLK